MKDKKKEAEERQAACDDMVEDLDKKIEELTQRCQDLENHWKRALADLENYRKRFDREIDRLKIAERRESAIILLEVLDNLERARAAEANTESAFCQGIQAIIEQAEVSLTRLGIEKVPSVGEKFDPLIHAAIEVVEGKEDNVVHAEQRPGYRIGDFLLRPALVIVERKAAQEKAQ